MHISTRHHILAAAACAAFLLTAPTKAHAQFSATTTGVPQQQNTPQQTSPLGHNEPDPSTDSAAAEMAANRVKLANEERHKRMEADADKLLQLATEIKAEVDHTTKDELSVTVLKKSAEMEKLAHDIKDRMRY